MKMNSLFKYSLKGFKNVVIVNGKRTPVGSFLGSLSEIQAPLLGSGAIDAALMSAGVAKEDVEEVIMGNVISCSVGQAPARQSAVRAGLRDSTICTTINKVCASGMKAVTFGAQSIMLGDSNIIVAGGFENMSLVPHYAYLRKPFTYGNPPMIDGIMFDGLTNAYDGHPMGFCAEKTNKDFKITRTECDDYCLSSYDRTLSAINLGLFKKEITPISYEADRGVKHTIETDEEPLRLKKDKVPKLKAVFEKDGVITAANASKINDGAAAMVLMGEDEAKKRGLRSVARIVGYADAEINPIDFSISPSSSINKLLKKCNKNIKDIDYFEINEAFSSVVLANMKILGLNRDKVNVHGGAVALGHPLGMSGARIILSLINVLQEKNGKLGIASICNGGGGSTSILIEKL